MTSREFKKIKLSYKKKLSSPILWIVNYFDKEPYELEDFYITCVISDLIEESLKKNKVYIINKLFGIESYKDLFDDKFDILTYELILKNKDIIKKKLDNIEILKYMPELLDEKISLKNILMFLNNFENLKIPKNNFFSNIINKIINTSQNYTYINILNLLKHNIEPVYYINNNNNKNIINIIQYLFLCMIYNEKYDICCNIVKLLLSSSFDKPLSSLLFNDKYIEFNINNVDSKIKILFIYYILYHLIYNKKENEDLDYLMGYRLDWGHFGYISHQILLNNLLMTLDNTNEKILIISDSTLGYQQYNEKELSLKKLYKNSHIEVKCGLGYMDSQAYNLLPDNYREYNTILSINGCNDLYLIINAFKETYQNIKISNLSYNEIKDKTLNLSEFKDLNLYITEFWSNF